MTVDCLPALVACIGVVVVDDMRREGEQVECDELARTSRQMLRTSRTCAASSCRCRSARWNTLWVLLQCSVPHRKLLPAAALVRQEQKAPLQVVTGQATALRRYGAMEVDCARRTGRSTRSLLIARGCNRIASVQRTERGSKCESR